MLKNETAVNGDVVADQLDANTVVMIKTESVDFKSPLEKILTEQFLACHKLSMKIFDEVYGRGDFNSVMDEDGQIRLVNISIRLMETCQKAALTINKLKIDNQQTVEIKNQDSHADTRWGDDEK